LGAASWRVRHKVWRIAPRGLPPPRPRFSARTSKPTCARTEAAREIAQANYL